LLPVGVNLEVHRRLSGWLRHIEDSIEARFDAQELDSTILPFLIVRLLPSMVPPAAGIQCSSA